jgi:putative transcriptional regulator
MESPCLLIPTIQKTDPYPKQGYVMAHRGRKLRIDQTGLGLSQEAFAGLLGVSSVELQTWEQVRQKIPEDVFAKLLDIKASQ